ncbi:MAG: hypothetical protein KAQ64_02325 [Candidatus Pacebacteria bacterium]|nr:hypothetical protein [Candidatus Paceibacterota bacterium]
METKIKNKSINKISFILALFFSLAQISQANIALGVSISAGEMINLINQSRMEAGLSSLSVNEKLAEAAKKRASDMFEFQYFDHNSPSGLTPWDFIRSAGYDYSYAGENLAIDFVTASGAHQALMESSSHRENILNSNYSEIGIAAIEGTFDGNNSIIIVEEFGAPLKKAVIKDYNSNENIEFVLEEKVNEINNLPSKKENVTTVEIAETKTDLSNIEENVIELFLEEESVDEQNDNSENIDTKEPNDDLLPADLDVYYFGPLVSLWTSSVKCENILCYSKNSEAIIDNPVLLSKNLDNEKVMGLISRTYAKDEYIKKYDYQQEPIESVWNCYFQNEFTGRIFLFYFTMAILLIFDSVSLVYFYVKKEPFRI